MEDAFIRGGASINEGRGSLSSREVSQKVEPPSQMRRGELL